MNKKINFQGFLGVILLIVLPALVGAASSDKKGISFTVEGTGRQLHSRKLQLQTEVLVRMRPGKSPLQLEGSNYRITPLGKNLWKIEGTASSLRQYFTSRDVESIQPEREVHATAIPSDALFSQQWSLDKIGAPLAWDVQTSSPDVVVVVLDTGIDFSHPDLQGNLWTNPEDGSHGFTCSHGEITPGGEDDNGHGTQVAGIIGATGNNDIGIAGMQWNVQLLSLKVLGSNGYGFTSDVALCLNKMIELKEQGVNIRVANLSFGEFGSFDDERNALLAAESIGILMVTAAGNSLLNLDSRPFDPTVMDNRGLISVLSTNENDELGNAASYGNPSNYGDVNVDIGAPGELILSTVPTGVCLLCNPSGYDKGSGTSHSAAHVTGAAAALFGVNPDLTIYEARDLLLDPLSYDSISDPLASRTTTGGRLNLYKTLNHPNLLSPVLNQFPTITAPPIVNTDVDQPMILTSVSEDPDGDDLKSSWTQLQSFLLWHYVWANLFTESYSDSIALPAPSVAIDATMPLFAEVNDRRGGSAQRITFYTVKADPNAGQPPTGELNVSDIAVDEFGYEYVVVSIPTIDPDGDTVYWGLEVTGPPTGYGTCCLTSGDATRVTFWNEHGIYRIRAYGMDSELHAISTDSVLVTIGDDGSTNIPPVTVVTSDVVSGPVPLTVNYDLSGSYDPDGSISHFSVFCNWTEDQHVGQMTEAQGSCTFSDPGPHQISFWTIDNENHFSVNDLFIMAQPPAIDGTEDPELAMTSPASGVVSGTVKMEADATAESRVTAVEFFSDQGLIAIDSMPPYSYTWKAPVGSHQVHARAYDLFAKKADSSQVPIDVIQSIFSDDFQDGDISDWKAIKGIWNVSAGELVNTASKKAIIEGPSSAACGVCSHELDVTMETAGSITRIYLWYQDANNYVSVDLNARKSKLKLLQKKSGITVLKKAISHTWLIGQATRIHVAYTGAGFDVAVDGTPAGLWPTNFAPAPGAIRILNKAAVQYISGQTVKVPATIYCDNILAQ